AYLAHLLGLPEPTYAHAPLALGPTGARLAKRDGAVTIADVAKRGLDARRVLGLLASSLGLTEPGEPVTPRELLARFDPARLPREPWIVDPATLGRAPVVRRGREATMIDTRPHARRAQ